MFRRDPALDPFKSIENSKGYIMSAGHNITPRISTFSVKSAKDPPLFLYGQRNVLDV